MKYSIAFAAAAAAPLAAALQQSTSGGAKIINFCSHDIDVQSVPAMLSGVENGQITSKTLKAGNQGDDSTFSSPWIALDPAIQGGWSFKINTLGNWNDIMQYEYTWHGGSQQVWYDMSFVNGVEKNHPDWLFVSPGTSPTKGAYQFPSDDANGMQVPISPSQTMTLQLCPGQASSGSSSGSSSSSSAAAPAPVAPSSTTAAAAPTTSSAAPAPIVPSPTTTSKAAATTAAPTTMQTSAAPTSPSKAIVPGIAAADIDIVTEFATVVVTVLATETASPHGKRHAHRHPHGRR